MVAKVHVYHSYNDYYLPPRSWTDSFADAGADFQTKLKKIKFVFSGIKCGMKWAQYACPASKCYDALDDGRKEIKEMTSLSLLPSSARAAYQLFFSINGLCQSIPKKTDPSQNSEKVQKAAKKVFFDGAKLINKSCKIVNLCNKMHIIEVERWGKYMPSALSQATYLTSAIPTIVNFKHSYCKIEKQRNGDLDKNFNSNQVDRIATRAQMILGLISTIFIGAALYCSIFIPPIISQGMTTCQIMISTVQFFRHRRYESSSSYKTFS